MAKLSATNPLTGKPINLTSPMVWVGAILFVIFILIVVGGGKWALDRVKGLAGLGAPAGSATAPGATLLGGY